LAFFKSAFGVFWHFFELNLAFSAHCHWHLSTLLGTISTVFSVNIFCALPSSTANENPIAQLRALSEQQHKHQHEKPIAHPQYATAHVLNTHYVLLHTIN
jgi:hypothetical protein